jgi:hypothetical protein
MSPRVRISFVSRMLGAHPSLPAELVRRLTAPPKANGTTARPETAQPYLIQPDQREGRRPPRAPGARRVRR